MSLTIPGQVVERTLRESRERVVYLVRRQGTACVTRVLRSSTVPRHYGRLVHDAVTQGRGSFTALGDDIAMTLEGYQVAARLLPDAGEPPMWPRAVEAGITAEGHVFVTTTWIEGVPLNQLPEGLSTADRERATAAILDLIGRMHGNHVAYGDLKLSNLVRRDDGGVSLIDLDTLREVPGPDVGAPSRDRTENWAAPEQIRRHETWLGSDVWALAQVLRELWGAELPPPWGGALAACRLGDPLARPTIFSLREHLIGAAVGLVDHAGRSVSLAHTAAEPGAGGGTETERVAEGGAAPLTERVGGGATERVEDSGVETPRRVPPPMPPRERAGCGGLLLSLGKAVFAVAAVVLVGLCAGGYAFSLMLKNQADEEAEALLAELKVHKTDPLRNGASERRRLAESAQALWDRQETPRTCAMRALTMVWDQRWHTDDVWSQADFDAASAAVSEPGCRVEPEAALARATLYAGACRRRDAKGVSTTDCQLSVAALATFWSRAPAGDGSNWMRVEAAWQELRARSALIARFAELKNPEGDDQFEAASARCAAAEPWLPFAPVNGPELVEECMVAAGSGADVAAFLHFADLRTAGLPTDKSARHRILAQLYTAGGPACADAHVTWPKRGGVVVTGAPWCVALGHVARRCPTDAAITIAEGSLGDDTHPWGDLALALAARSGPCLE